MSAFVQKHKEKIVLVAGGLALYALWIFGYEGYLAKNTTPTGLDWNLNRLLALATGGWFSLFGQLATVETFSIYPHLLFLNGQPIISVDTPCNALPMMYLFASFVLVYPGSWKRKALFIPAGVLFINLLNLVRIIALSYVSIYMEDYFYFNHKYAFQIAVYTLVISLWLYWAFYGHDQRVSWMEGIRDFVRFRFFQRLGQLI